MGQVVTSALEADIVHLALAAVGVLAVALALLVYFGSRAISGILAANATTVAANGQLTATLVKQTDVLQGMQRTMETSQQIQRDQTAETKRLGDTLERHEEKSAGYVAAIETHAEERHKTLMDRINANMTDLIGETGKIVSESTRQILDAVQPMVPALGNLRENLEQTQREYLAKMEALGDQVAAAQRQVLQVIDTARGEVREQVASLAMGGGGPDTEPDRDRASGGTGDGGFGGGPAIGLVVGADAVSDAPDSGTGGHDHLPPAGTGGHGGQGSAAPPAHGGDSEKHDPARSGGFTPGPITGTGDSDSQPLG